MQMVTLARTMTNIFSIPDWFKITNPVPIHFLQFQLMHFTINKHVLYYVMVYTVIHVST
jgi:hypothetical protein